MAWFQSGRTLTITYFQLPIPCFVQGPGTRAATQLRTTLALLVPGAQEPELEPKQTHQLVLEVSVPKTNESVISAAHLEKFN